MTEKLTRGILREGPVWGLPKEAVYSVTRQRPRTLPSPLMEGRAASAEKPRKGWYRRRGGKKEKEQGESSKGGGRGKGGEGRPLNRDKPPTGPLAAPKGTKDPRPPRKGKKKE